MNEEIKSAILAKIKEYNRIIISRHKRPDGDAVGSTMGLREVLRDSFPEKEVLLVNEDSSDFTAFLGEEDSADDSAFSDALVIVLDTATAERISNSRYALGRELIKIDHHIETAPYGDLSWVEENRSSCCEMIADFYISHRDVLKLSVRAATCIYTGMVTDSGRFRYRETSGETLRCAAYLLDFGIDTDTLYSRLYMSDLSELKYKAYVLEHIKLTENGVAYFCVDAETQKKYALSGEQASLSVSYLDSIKDSLIWIAFIEYPDGSFRVRLRSRFVTVSELAERYGGGGHACAAGATVYSKKEVKALLKAADALLGNYKASHDGWL